MPRAYRTRTFTCDACGRECRLRNHVTVDPGPPFSVCRRCAKRVQFAGNLFHGWGVAFIEAFLTHFLPFAKADVLKDYCFHLDGDRRVVGDRDPALFAAQVATRTFRKDARRLQWVQRTRRRIPRKIPCTPLAPPVDCGSESTH
jgi:hypothetical protein